MTNPLISTILLTNEVMSVIALIIIPVEGVFKQMRAVLSSTAVVWLGHSPVSIGTRGQSLVTVVPNESSLSDRVREANPKAVAFHRYYCGS